MTESTVVFAGLVVVAAPALMLAVLAIASIADRPVGERMAAAAMRVALALAGVGLAVVAVAVFANGPLLVEAGTWFTAPGYQFRVSFLFDRLSIPFAALTIGLGGVVGVFAERYLHREPGYNRFFVLLALFVTGLLVTTLASTIELVYAGWELVGLSSALLIAFFHERPAPVRNGLRTFVVYRGCDAGLLAAAVLVHHWLGTGSLVVLLGPGPWPAGSVPLTQVEVTVVAVAILVAALGKSAQIPFSGWLPRSRASGPPWRAAASPRTGSVRTSRAQRPGSRPRRL